MYKCKARCSHLAILSNVWRKVIQGVHGLVGNGNLISLWNYPRVTEVESLIGCEPMREDMLLKGVVSSNGDRDWHF